MTSARLSTAFTGDPELVSALRGLVRSPTRRLAAAVLVPASPPRTVFRGADVDTAFEIGSVTKVLTGMALAEALGRKEITLETTVSQLLPELASSGLRDVTVRELATHTSGLPRTDRSLRFLLRAVLFGLVGVDPYRGTGTTSLLRVAARTRLRTRGRSAYSNLGAAVLGHALARRAGTDYPSLLADRVFGPVGATGALTRCPVAAATSSGTTGRPAVTRRSSCCARGPAGPRWCWPTARGSRTSSAPPSPCCGRSVDVGLPAMPRAAQAAARASRSCSAVNRGP